MVGLVAVASGCGGDNSADLQEALLDPDHQIWNTSAPDVFRARFETTKGAFVIEARRDWAPYGVDRFYHLVQTGFFDDSRFFRVRAGFIAQFGIPGDPTVAAAWRHEAIPDDSVRQSNTRGFVAFAMTGPDTRTTQLYINYGDNSRLDTEGFAPIGRVIEGMDVVDQLYAEYDEDAGGGMRGGNQGKIFRGGNSPLDEAFPDLDRLMQANVVWQGA
jgi:homoserine O-acetyltransferase